MNTPSLAISAKQRRLLVADDDPFYREIATAALADAGYCVETAGDGVEALAQLSGLPFDMAIIDFSMPGMDGFEVISRVRAGGPNQFTPIIVITGNDDTESVERAFQIGATSFVAKPLNWPLFVQHVNFVYKAAQAENDLRDAVRTTEFLSDLKGKVLSVLVGEFQAPLRTALAMSELLRKEVYGPLGQRIYLEYAEDLHKAIEQLNATQLKLMNAGRVLAEELLLQEEEVDLGEAVSNAISAMRDKAERRGIEMEERISIPAGSKLKCDRALVSQALKTLIESSVQFAPRNSGITVDARLDQEGEFSFTVEDSAPALPDSIVREILNQSPSRADVQVSTVTRNTSLTISRVLAEAHQGRLALSSTMGAGTVSRLLLPRSRISRAAAESAGQSPAGAAAREVPLFRTRPAAS